jgi:conjugal transfer mating pair stabilization protein TraN
MKHPGQRRTLLKERYFLNRFSALVLILLFQALTPLDASEVKNYGAGKDFASQHQAPQPKDARDIPGFKGTNIPEAGLSQGNIQGALTRQMKEKGNVGSFINESHDQRLRFKIDPLKDPIFTESDKIVADPMATLKVKATEVDEPVRETKSRHTCEEEGDTYLLTCVKELGVTVTKIPPKATSFGFSLTNLWNKQRGFWNKYFTKGQGRHSTRALDFGGDNKGGDPGYAKHYTYVPNVKVDSAFLTDLFALTGRIDEVAGYPYVKRGYGVSKAKMYADPRSLPKFAESIDKLKIKRVISLSGMGNSSYAGQHFWLYRFAQIELDIVEPPIIKEFWTSGCDLIEPKVDQGLCVYKEKICTQGKQTRLINGEAITKPCWQYTHVYECSYPVKNTCGDLKAKGCVQIKSQCKKMIEKTCVHYEQTYECVTRTGGGKKTKIEGDAPWCLDGNCVEQGFAANTDMAEALSKLMLFREIQKDMDRETPSIFKGTEYGCNRNCVDFKDCCGSGKGWGVSLGLAGCNEKEKALAQLRQDKKCVYVGTYCAEKVLNLCIRKKSNFCCFGTKLARLIHEQGRPQLKMTFGDGEHPQCRGFTVEELTKLDFDKIDLSELLSELTSKFKAPNMSKLSQDFSQDWKHRIPKMEKDVKPPLQTLKENKKDAVF